MSPSMIAARVAGVPETAFAHGAAQFLVLHELSGGLHGGEQGGLREAGWRLGFLGHHLDGGHLGVLALLDGHQLAVPGIGGTCFFP